MEIPQLKRQNAVVGFPDVELHFVSGSCLFYAHGVLEVFMDRAKASEILAQKSNSPVLVNLVKLIDRQLEISEEAIQKDVVKFAGNADEMQSCFEVIVADVLGENVSWSRVVAVMAFAVVFAKRFRCLGFGERIKDWLACFLEKHAAPWIVTQEGSWDSIIPYAQKRQ